MNSILNIATRIIRQVGFVLLKKYEHINIKHNYKSNEIILNNLNKYAEQYIINLIKKYYPQHSYTTKNYYVYNNNVNWIINFESNINIIKKLPYCTISMAIQINNRTEIAIIYELINNELFTAIRGQGAQLNNRRLRTNSNKILSNSIITTNLITDNINDINKKLSFLKKLIMAKVDLRCHGTNVLDLAYLAASRIDGIFLYKISNINYYISGILLAIESGNLIFDHNGNTNYSKSSNLLIGNAKITNLILEIINN
ncbi:MAG: inositol monophosphatase [Candidatus Lightella neohaematopini]|nr:inositol monophosphatase [Candidatus Lightella neohaematopini]